MPPPQALKGGVEAPSDAAAAAWALATLGVKADAATLRALADKAKVRQQRAGQGCSWAVAVAFIQGDVASSTLNPKVLTTTFPC